VVETGASHIQVTCLTTWVPVLAIFFVFCPGLAMNLRASCLCLPAPTSQLPPPLLGTHAIQFNLVFLFFLQFSSSNSTIKDKDLC
jgi:hypothetical protein